VHRVWQVVQLVGDLPEGILPARHVLGDVLGLAYHPAPARLHEAIHEYRARFHPTVPDVPIDDRLFFVLKDGPLIRGQLVERLGVPRTTIFDGLKRLIHCGDVKKYPFVVAGRSQGRPQILFALVDGKK
jgi:hypothetical protein